MNIFSHIAIIVDDLVVMKDFYCTVFGMKTIWMLDDEKCYLTTGGGDILGLQINESNQKPDMGVALEEIDFGGKSTPNFIHYGTVTDDKKEYLALRGKLIGTGVLVTDMKISRDGSESFYCYDPEKNCLQICFIPRGYFDQLI